MRVFKIILIGIGILSITSFTLAVLTPNDRLFDSWDENNPEGNNYGQEIVKLPSAWDFTVGSSSFPVAVVDSGFDIEHEDLKLNLNLEESDKYDLLKTEDKDYDPHGTMVAGITAARGNNNLGIAGVMWEANLGVYNYSYFTGEVTLLFKRVREATPTSIILMINSAIKKGAKVINLSYGYCPESDPNCGKDNKVILEDLQLSDNLFRTVVRHADLTGKDVLFIIAAGNNKNDIQTDSPARIWSEFDNVISVAAIDEDENLSGYSNRGDVTVAAPGDNIYSTLPPPEYYGTDTGTSMAAPFVSGLAGLIWSEAEKEPKIELTAVQVKEIIINGAELDGKKVPGQPFYIINAFKSLALVRPPIAVDLAEPTDITESSMILSWSENEDPDFQSYCLYRDTNPDVGLDDTLVTTITDRDTLSFEDTNLSSNTTYYYKVFVFDAADLSSASNEVSAKTSILIPEPGTDILLYFGNGGMGFDIVQLKEFYEGKGINTVLTDIFPDDLNRFKLIILLRPGALDDSEINFFTPEQISAFENFLLKGNRLVILGEVAAYGLNTINKLLQDINIDIQKNDSNVIPGRMSPPMTDITEDQITQDVSGILFSAAADLELIGDAKSLVRKNTTGEHLMAVDHFNGGPPRPGSDVVVSGNSSFFNGSTRGISVLSHQIFAENLYDF